MFHYSDPKITTADPAARSAVPGNRSWRPDLYAEIAKFIGRMTPVLDDYCTGFSVGTYGQFIAHFAVRPLGGTEPEPVWYEIDQRGGGSTLTTLRYQWKSPTVVTLKPEYLFTCVDKK